MNEDELKSILEQHRLWFDGNGGKCAALRCADLQSANLQGANLRCADLRCADLQGANLQSANLRCADLRCADLQGANLQSANLRCADLRCADLQGADMDYSIWPLQCGSAGVKVDKRLFCQLVAHLCSVEVDDEECIQAQVALLPLAEQSHVADDLRGWFVKEGEQ